MTKFVTSSFMKALGTLILAAAVLAISVLVPM